MVITNIQVLRGIAVLLVLLFHLEVELFSFGYLGVDIFFLISGFLMPIIIPKYDAYSFIKARFLRLIPALSAVVLVSLSIGYFLLIPGEFQSLAYSSLLALVFSSEFYFMLNTGYFDISSELQPMLHTWSLGNEFLGYVIVFGFLIFFSKDKAKLFAILMAGLAALYILFNPTTNYFDPIPRLFLFFTGFYCATVRKTVLIDDKYLALISILSLALFAYFYGPDIAESIWPSYAIFILPFIILPIFFLQAPLIPTAALNRVFSKLGDWSYSIYLWHWPIIVYERIFLRNQQINTKEAILIFFVSIFAGAVSYYTLERKIRLSFFTAIFSVILILFVIFTDGASHRVSPEVTKYSSIEKMLDNSEKTFISFKNINYVEVAINESEHNTLFMGDSHSQHFLPLYKSNYNGNIYRLKRPQNIRERWPSILDLLQQLKIDKIIVAYRFTPEKSNEIEQVIELLNELVKDENIDVAIVRDIPSFGGDPVACLISRNSILMFKDCGFDIENGLPISKVDNAKNPVWNMVLTKANDEINLIDSHINLCDKAQCKMTINGEFIMRDNNHLNERLSEETNKIIYNMIFKDKNKS